MTPERQHLSLKEYIYDPITIHSIDPIVNAHFNRVNKSLCLPLKSWYYFQTSLKEPNFQSH